MRHKVRKHYGEEEKGTKKLRKMENKEMESYSRRAEEESENEAREEIKEAARREEN